MRTSSLEDKDEKERGGQRIARPDHVFAGASVNMADLEAAAVEAAKKKQHTQLVVDVTSSGSWCGEPQLETMGPSFDFSFWSEKLISKLCDRDSSLVFDRRNETRNSAIKFRVSSLWGVVRTVVATTAFLV